MRRRGHLVVLEGADGVGKSTLAAALVEGLDRRGLTCRGMAFPGNEPRTLGALVNRLHHDSSSVAVDAITPLALQTAHIAAHLDAIERAIRPILNTGESVILDRFWWSTEVYGITSALSPDVLEGLVSVERKCWGEVQPLVAFLITRHQPWREVENTPVWGKLAGEYRRLALREQLKNCVVIVENNGALTDLADLMTRKVLEEIRAMDEVVLGQLDQQSLQ